MSKDYNAMGGLAAFFIGGILVGAISELALLQCLPLRLIEIVEVKPEDQYLKIIDNEIEKIHNEMNIHYRSTASGHKDFKCPYDKNLAARLDDFIKLKIEYIKRNVYNNNTKKGKIELTDPPKSSILHADREEGREIQGQWTGDD